MFFYSAFINIFQRLCPDLYHSKLQQAMAISSNGVNRATLGIHAENGTDSCAIGTDSMMMLTDECTAMDEPGGPMPAQNGVETVHSEQGTGSSAAEVMTVGASSMPPHTCCTTRTQLCTMSFQQVRTGNNKLSHSFICHPLIYCTGSQVSGKAVTLP